MMMVGDVTYFADYLMMTTMMEFSFPKFMCLGLQGLESWNMLIYNYDCWVIMAASGSTVMEKGNHQKLIENVIFKVLVHF